MRARTRRLVAGATVAALATMATTGCDRIVDGTAIDIFDEGDHRSVHLMVVSTRSVVLRCPDGGDLTFNEVDLDLPCDSIDLLFVEHRSTHPLVVDADLVGLRGFTAIVGGPGADVISARADGDARLTVDGHAGDDVVIVGTRRRGPIYPAFGIDARGGDGDDRLIDLGFVDALPVTAPDTGPIIVLDGGTGADAIHGSDARSASERLDVADGTAHVDLGARTQLVRIDTTVDDDDVSVDLAPDRGPHVDIASPSGRLVLDLPTALRWVVVERAGGDDATTISGRGTSLVRVEPGPGSNTAILRPHQPIELRQPGAGDWRVGEATVTVDPLP
jgi:hypothetical protein